MNFELFRLETFKSWPADAPVTKERLAKAGFFYANNALIVQCFECGLLVENWEYGESAMGKHKTLRPHCNFVRGDIISSNVSLEVVNENTLKEPHIRLITYRTWPKENLVRSASLVDAGFYYLNAEDKTKCVSCEGVAVNWNEGDKPKVTHAILFPSCVLVQQFMENEEYRELTFRNFPKPNLDVKKMARAGFFYIGEGDHTKCFCCGQVVLNWEEQDDPDSEHKRLFPNCQFVKEVIDNRSRTNNIENSVDIPACPNLVNYSSRLETFANLPSTCNQTPEDLAEAGLYYAGVGDLTRCFHCNAGLQHWHKDDIPWIEHAKWFPNCHFLKSNKSEEFIKNCAELRGTNNSLSKIWAEEATQKALSIGINQELLRKALITHLKEYGCSFSKSEDLIEYTLSQMIDNGVSEVKNKRVEKPLTTVEELSEENRALKDSKMCKICMDEELQIVFMPCAHFATCDGCSNLVQECPICRIKIDSRIKTFLS